MDKVENIVETLSVKDSQDHHILVCCWCYQFNSVEYGCNLVISISHSCVNSIVYHVIVDF